MVPTYEALDPRTTENDVELVPLAVRPATLDGLRIALVQTMPPGSGIEPVIESVAATIAGAAPSARTTHYLRTNFMMHDATEVDTIVAGFDAAVLVCGPAATQTYLTFVFGTELERRGCPVAVVYFDALAGTAAHSSKAVGAPLRSRPIGNGDFTSIVGDLTNPTDAAERAEGVRRPPARPRVAVRGTLAEIDDHFLAEGWSDGLPIVPPTQDAVAEMLTGTSRAPGDVVTDTLRPEARRTTVEHVAIAAVMAGARPDYLPVILAAASVFGDVQFESMTRSVNSFAFAQFVSGPIAGQVGMNGGLGALGPGNRANATIGRAVNLLIRTAGGAQAGVNVTPTQGNALAYTAAYCEDEAASPWPPLHTDLGYERHESVVSILLGGWAHNGNFYYGDLDDVARSLQHFEIPQTGAFVFVAAKRAHQLATEGWTKAAIERHLYERATIRLGDFRASGFWPMSSAQIAGTGPSSAPVWPRDYLTRADDDVVPGYPPGTIKVVVTGSDTSSLMQVWKWQLHRSVPVDPWR